MKLTMTKKVILALILAVLFSAFLIFIKESYPTVYSVCVNIANMVGTIFLRLLKLVIVPIIVFSLMNGIVNLNSISSLKSLGFKTIGIFLLTMSMALFLSITISYNLGAGASYSSDQFHAVAKAVTNANPPSLTENVITLFPDNIISPMLNNNMLQLVFIAIVFAIAILGLEDKKRQPLVQGINNLETVVIGVITMIMKLTPYGVFALLTRTLATQGFALLGAMVEYALIMFLVMIVHFIVVYIPLIKWAGAHLFLFLKKCFPALAVAFSTSSSSATLPVAMKVAEESLGAKKTYVSFVLPMGTTINMNATAIMQGLAVVFLANIYGVHMSLYDLIGAAALALMATVGAAGIPGSGLITLTIVLLQYGIPIEGIGIIIGIDRLMEMFRTLMNILGDMIATVIVAKSEKGLDLSILNNKEV
ncbi:MAG: dicarboxylate/amino acid:cation symporter [Alphaproteobacteria bacterium]|jgi:Na+/H+-dicarboxylate symporter|nr:dicarboxylate/amino acid:cation symporter [Alphaproteobacteria bacterium]